MRQHNLRLSDELWEQVEQRRGKVPRNPWIVEVLQEAVERALEEPSAPGLASRSAETLAPAEQSEPRRSGPIPKSPSTRDRLEIERIRREQFDNANRLIAAKRKKKR